MLVLALVLVLARQSFFAKGGLKAPSMALGPREAMGPHLSFPFPSPPPLEVLGGRCVEVLYLHVALAHASCACDVQRAMPAGPFWAYPVWTCRL